MDSKPGTIDLHVHSSASDGSFSPAQLLEQALALELSAIAITDHDTVAGAAEALAHGVPPGLEFLTGVEISAAYPPAFQQGGSLHILGYGIRTDHGGLNALFQKQQNARADRNPLIIEKLNALGIYVSLDDIAADCGKPAVARPHIAEYLVKTGHAADMDDAFDRWLGKGQPAYVDKFRVAAQDAIALIQDAGGLAVMAHPGVSAPDDTLEELVTTLTTMGLSGIEVYYPGQAEARTESLEKLARRHGLLMTGGSDFHGDINPEIQMGSGLGDLEIPYAVFAQLKTVLDPLQPQATKNSKTP